MAFALIGARDKSDLLVDDESSYGYRDVENLEI
jgi:hypothetical protein